MRRMRGFKLGILLEYGGLMSFASKRQRWSLSLGTLLEVFGVVNMLIGFIWVQ